jgi:hypothetical protein
MGRLWIAALLLLVGGCSAKGDAANDLDRNVDKEVVGEVILESYALDLTFGYKLSGMYITSDGKVWSYERTAVWYPERLKTGQLSRRDMLTKHEGATQIGTVDPSHLHDVAAMIKPAAHGPVTKAGDVGAGGGGVDLAYLYDPEARVYYEVILAGRGDRVASNSAPEAQLLLDYLHEVKGLVRPE